MVICFLSNLWSVLTLFKKYCKVSRCIEQNIVWLHSLLLFFLSQYCLVKNLSRRHTKMTQLCIFRLVDSPLVTHQLSLDCALCILMAMGLMKIQLCALLCITLVPMGQLTFDWYPLTDRNLILKVPGNTTRSSWPFCMMWSDWTKSQENTYMDKNWEEDIFNIIISAVAGDGLVLLGSRSYANIVITMFKVIICTGI